MAQAKIIRVRKKKFVAMIHKPRVTLAPWCGYSKHDAPRGTPLPVCPALRCRRAKACLSAHDNLYCQRTHFSPAEQEKRSRRDPLRLELDSFPPVVDPKKLSDRMERVNNLAAVKQAHARRMTEKWKQGELDELYGKYSAKGVVVAPPPKVYVEEARSRATQTRVKALG